MRLLFIECSAQIASLTVYYNKEFGLQSQENKFIVCLEKSISYPVHTFGGLKEFVPTILFQTYELSRICMAAMFCKQPKDSDITNVNSHAFTKIE